MNGMNVQFYRQSHLVLLARSANCSDGHVTIWHVLGQCLEDVYHVTGFILGMLAIPLWTSAHLCLYYYLSRRTRSPRQRDVHLFVFMHLMAGILGLIGACLALQLVSQILFAFFASIVVVCTWVHTYIFSKMKKKQKTVLKVNRSKNKLVQFRSMFSLCLFPVAVTSSVLGLVVMVTSVSRDTRDIKLFTEIDEDVTRIPLMWVVGYIFGALAGITLICCKFIDIFDAYITVESGSRVILAYILDMSGELFYVVSVVSQSQTWTFFWHCLPWTLPRLISAGLDIGIVIQRHILKRRGKKRNLSNEDASCLLSDEDSDFLSDGSEEVIWMPLKCVESGVPAHPVCASRVQILSESEFFSDSVDFCDSRRQSILADGIGPIAEHEQATDGDKSIETDEDRSSDSYNDSLEGDPPVADSSTLHEKIATLNIVTSTEKTTTWINTNSDITIPGTNKDE